MGSKVYLVGAGPGSLDLITVKGLEILRQADVVIYDYLVDKELLNEAKEGAELICCDKPRTFLDIQKIPKYLNKQKVRGKLGKDRYSDGFLVHQERINNLIVKKAKQGRKVVRLKNGDPAIFSRLSQELESLVKNKIGFEVVPGVTAASAASCFSGIPLTDRRFASACVLVTGHEDPTKEKSSLDWPSLAKSGTIVLYMAVENLSEIVKQLLEIGKSKNTPVAIIKDASLLTQKVLVGDLSNIVKKAREQKIRPPAVIIIGEVVKLEKEFNWFKKTKRILFTGISPKRYFERGFIFHLPLIKIKPLENYTKFDNMIKKICHTLSTINYKPAFDWIVFTSRYGVQYFSERLNKTGYDARYLKGIRIAAIGNSTKNRLLDFGILADLVPKEESSLGLLEAFKKFDIKNKKILLPRSDISDKGLSEGLSLQGAEVTSCVAYKNAMPENLPDLDFNFFDEIMFSSPSGVRNFVKRYKGLSKRLKVRCIGEVTFREAKKWRLLD